LLPQEESKERIVQLLREKLAEAEAGNIQCILMLTEDATGKFTSDRDGFTDQGIVFSVEVIKKRVLGKYV
jgi:hypothetical protein